MATKAEGVLHYQGKTYDPDDLDYEEVFPVRRIIRREMWDEAVDGPFDWMLIDEFYIYPATLTVFMQREDPDYTVDQALKLKLTELTDEAPPTKPAPKPRSNGASRSKPKAESDGKQTPVATGSLS